MCIAEESRSLVAASLSATAVQNDTNGNMRLVKKSSNNCGRDDVSAALTLAAGAIARLPVRAAKVYRGFA